MLQAKENPLARPVRYVKGIGPKRSEIFKRLGVETVEDLFYFFPRRYDDRSSMTPIADLAVGSFATVRGEVLTCSLKRIPKMAIFELAVGDESGFIHAVWFNQPYLGRQFHEGDIVILSGKVELYNRRIQMNTPDYEILSQSVEDTIHTARIVPVYPLSEGLGQRGIRRAMKDLVDREASHFEEFLPSSLCEKFDLVNLSEAIQNMHFPGNQDELAKARQRMIFEEFFVFELMLLQKIHRDRHMLTAYALESHEAVFLDFRKNLPFTLTKSQETVIGEIARDASRTTPMRRLLQGDVGSGKTVVASFLLVLAVKTGLQAAMMVPTEVLAEQHYENLRRLLAPFGVRLAFLTGSVQGRERGEILSDLRNHSVDVVVGTHALIQEGIKFAKLGVLVIDEQHKFGVRQRAALLSGNVRPHLLVMTATPIPRTLGLTLYGDLDISTIEELPSGRKPIKTYWIVKTREEEVLNHMASRAAAGEQAYVIYPIIEETEKMDLVAATDGYERLRKGIFRNLRVGLIHGRLSRWDKESVMKDFRDGKVRILVATSVVEVGIDNPDATMMVIEHAERFGLSQLHQLRGRIGRGHRESHCFLFGDPPTEEGRMRLRVLTKTTDGFQIAEEDLKLRGPGDFLGTRQSGIPLFRLGDLVRDTNLLRTARHEALSLLTEDPDLSKHELLRQKVERETRHFMSAIRD